MNVVLFEPKIPPNVGSTARLCAATNTKLHLVGELDFIVNNKHYERAGLDYWEYLSLEMHKTLEDLQAKYKEGNFYYLSTKAKKNYTEVAYTDNDFIIFGPETKGLPENLIFENIDFALKIPMTGKVRSLNLSNSVSIVLYEALRQIKGF